MAFFPNLRVEHMALRSPTDPSGTWGDWTASCLVDGVLESLNFRGHELDESQPGRVTFDIRDPDRAWDPGNPDAFLVIAGWYPIGEMVRVIADVGGTDYGVGFAMIDDWPSGDRGRSNHVRVQCTTPVRFFQDLNLDESTWDYEVDKLAPDAWYKLDERGGADADDSSGNNHDGDYEIRKPTIDGGGQVRSASHANYKRESIVPSIGRDSYDMGEHMPNARGWPQIDTPGGIHGGTQWSMGCWMQSAPQLTGAEQPVLLNNIEGNPNYIKLSLTPDIHPAGVGRFLVTGSLDGVAMPAIGDAVTDSDDGQPHFVMVTRSNATLRLYVDGAQAAQGTISNAGVAHPMSRVRIGGAGDETGWYSGRIQDVVLWNRVLTAAEVLDLYNTGAYGLDSATSDTVDATVMIDKVIEMSGYGLGAGLGRADDNKVKVAALARQSAWGYLRKIEMTTLGRIWIDNDGVFQHISGQEMSDKANKIVIGNDYDGDPAIDLPMHWIDYGFTPRGAIINRAQIIHTAGSGWAGDPTSRARNGTHDGVFDTHASGTPRARQIAQAIVDRYSTPRLRISSVRCRPTEQAHYEHLLDLQPGDRVAVRYLPQSGVGGLMNEACHVEGVSHRIGPGHAWESTIHLSPRWSGAETPPPEGP